MRRWVLAAVVVLLALAGSYVRAEDVPKPSDEPSIFSEEQQAAMASSEETFEFQAEVTRLMDIIINALYKDREIFLRELISNAADASDKIRFQSLTDRSVLGEGELADLDIRLKFDKEKKTLTITDKGIGMTKAELIKHLGVVAKSGTSDFLQKVAAGGDTLSLIGQFGVGFYSVYLIADKVTVASKSNDEAVQHVWQSSADGKFSVTVDPRGNTLGRGTEITMYLKEDATEFLNEQRLENLVAKYSQFINFPIFLLTSKEVEVEVPVEEEPEEAVDLDAKDKQQADGEAAEDDADAKDGEDDAEAEEKPKTKKVKETRHEWKRLNTAKAIWTRPASEISEEEYTDFYKSLTKDEEGFQTKIHFAAEGEIAFRSILYIPKKADPGLYDKYYEKSNQLKLYVRRVLITDDFEDFLPRYLNFIKGVVDSEDLPLNVSRETLAQSRILRVMSKKLTRKVLDMLTRLAEGKDEEEEAKDKEEGAEEAAKEEEGKKENKKYLEFWEQFGKSIKLGVIDDRANKAKLSKLLRFVSSKSEGKLISLQDYVDRMKEDQKYIYYITGESNEIVASSPFMERLRKRDLEVLYLTDPLDEYVVQVLTDFDDHQLASVTKKDLKLPGEKESDRKKVEEDFSDLTKWLKELYGDRVEEVTISNRISSSPCVLVTGQYGWSANMERIMKAQTFSDASKQPWMFSRKTMEINPRHPIILELKAKAAADPKDKALEDLANLMYDAALLNSGFSMSNPSEFAGRIHRVMSLGLGIDPAAQVPEEEEVTQNSDDDADAAAEQEEAQGAAEAEAEESEGSAAQDSKDEL